MTVAYFDSIGGASGDMILGALVDCGLRLADLEAQLAMLDAEGFALAARRDNRRGVSGTLVTVELTDEARRPRHWRDFIRITRNSDLPEPVVDLSCVIFRRLGDAEASVHGTSPEQTQLHELGELDTLVDVVGAVAGLHLLGVDSVYCSPLPTGSGVINSAHGLLPVPSPATAALFAISGAPTGPAPRNARRTGEMVTPTGAAILTTLAEFRQPEMTLTRVGYGLGSRDPEQYPNALALWLGEEAFAGYAEGVTLLETNIDDMTGEMLAYAQERLFALGARDVWFTPIQMKKNRPGTMLSAIVPRDAEAEALRVVVAETSTLGVRVRPLRRYEVERKVVSVETEFGTMRVKVKRLEGRNVSVAPEFDDCRRVALERGEPLQRVYRETQRQAEATLDRNGLL